jgi:hypothetical protein
MRLHELQDFIVSRLLSHPLFAGAGMELNRGILKEDGTYPKTAFLEQSLEEFGLAIIVWEPESLESSDENSFGSCVYDVWVPVIIEEATKKNRGGDGTGLSWEQVVEEIQKVVVGSNEEDATPGSKPFRSADKPWKNFGSQDGVHRCAVNFVKRHVVKPYKPTP